MSILVWLRNTNFKNKMAAAKPEVTSGQGLLYASLVYKSDWAAEQLRILQSVAVTVEAAVT